MEYPGGGGYPQSQVYMVDVLGGVFCACDHCKCIRENCAHFIGKKSMCHMAVI